MRRIWIGTAAAALATAFVIPVALAQETQQGKQPSATEGSGASGGMHRNSGPAPTGQRANQPGTQTQGMQGQMGQNERERDQFGKGEMKGGSAQTNQPGTHTQGMQAQTEQNDRERDQSGKGQMRGGSAQTQQRTDHGNAMQSGNTERSAEQPGRREGAAEGRPGQAQTGAGGQAAGGKVEAMGKANLPHDKASEVARTLRTSGGAQVSPNINVHDLRVGADLPGAVVINPLPPAIVEIVPEFRGYDYFVVGDEVVIVDPARRQVVEIIEDVG